MIPHGRKMMPLALRSLMGAIALLLLAATHAWAVDVGETRWGFDGRATPQCFNLLSVLVVNPEATPFEGKLELCESIGGGRRVGAILAEDLYIAPNSSRWVQFYPYVKEPYEEWWLQWGRRASERADVRRPVLAKQGLVMLVDSDDALSAGRSVRQFLDHLFPPIATATDSLKAVLLDHVPQWEESRRQSFYDWLYRGGRLHILKDADGAYPHFTSQLAELNNPVDRFRVGIGEVFRHDRQRSRLDRAFIDKLSGEPNASPEKADLEALKNAANGANGLPGTRAARRNVPSDPLFADVCGGLFAFLKTLSRPHHNWPLIYAMALVYVVTVVPGVHYLGRKRFDYRLVYGTLVGLIVLFSIGFAYFGRRGHKEASAVNTLAVARQLSGGMWDVTSWSNVFVISGADYEIVHGGSARLYSTAQTVEAVNGTIRNGNPGRFDVDIPPFSSQPFIARMKVNGDRNLLTVREFSAKDNALKKLVIEPANSFPRPADPAFAYVLSGTRLWPMDWSHGRLELSEADSVSLTDFFGSVSWESLSPFSIGNGRFVGNASQDQRPPPFDDLLRPLMAWSLDLQKFGDISTFHFPDDTLRLFVWSELPDKFKVDNKLMGSQQGRTLFLIDVPKPVKP
jgi:hypothetical protein